MMDWCVMKGDARYKLDIPPLTKDEEQLISGVSESFKELSKHRDLHESNLRGLIAEQLVDHCRQHNIILDHEQEQYLSTYLYYNLAGYSGLDTLLADDGIEEIGVIGIHKPVYVYHASRGWLDTNLYFRSEDAAIAIINKIARQVGRRITYQNPNINAVLPNGARLHASIPPISDVEMTVRKFRSNPITVADLIDNHTYSLDSIAFLSLLFQLDYNILVAGNTASGKTSTLNALFSFIPLSDRVLIIEETPEINIPHAHKIKMVSNQELKIDMRTLVEDTLRMRPDRVVVGEIRTREEVSAFIETILSGQARGSYATFHAQSSEEAVKRMVSQGISLVDVSSINFMVVQRRMIKYDPKTRRYWEERKGVEIAELSDDSRINPIFKLNQRTGDMEGSYTKSRHIQDIADSFGISSSELAEEMEKRKEMLVGLKKKSFEETVFSIQSSLFSQGFGKESLASDTTGH